MRLLTVRGVVGRRHLHLLLEHDNLGLLLKRSEDGAVCNVAKNLLGRRERLLGRARLHAVPAVETKLLVKLAILLPRVAKQPRHPRSFEAGLSGERCVRGVLLGQVERGA